MSLRYHRPRVKCAKDLIFQSGVAGFKDREGISYLVIHLDQSYGFGSRYQILKMEIEISETPPYLVPINPDKIEVNPLVRHGNIDGETLDRLIKELCIPII